MREMEPARDVEAMTGGNRCRIPDDMIAWDAVRRATREARMTDEALALESEHARRIRAGECAACGEELIDPGESSIQRLTCGPTCRQRLSRARRKHGLPPPV